MAPGRIHDPTGKPLTARRFDRQEARAALERGLANAPARVADGFARAVRRSPDGRLERLLRTPVRRAVLGGIFSQMPRYFDRAGAKGVDATVRWRITGRADGRADVWDVTIHDARCRVRRGESQAEPRVTITTEAAEFVRLATGNSDPMKAYFSGRIQLGGDIMFAARLQSLFRIPAHQKVQDQP
jgi:predicted lipid carrier protein YhbT